MRLKRLEVNGEAFGILHVDALSGEQVLEGAAPSKIQMHVELRG